MNDPTTDPIFKEVHMNSVSIKMELDTGVSLSVITLSKIAEPLQPTTVRLRTYTGEAMRSGACESLVWSDRLPINCIGG